MPTILLILGWRVFFYSNENNEPIHVHCQKGDKECKFWLDTKHYELKEAFSHNMTIRDKREIKQVLYEHFDYIEREWSEFQKRKKK